MTPTSDELDRQNWMPAIGRTSLKRQMIEFVPNYGAGVFGIHKAFELLRVMAVRHRFDQEVEKVSSFDEAVAFMEKFKTAMNDAVKSPA